MIGEMVPLPIPRDLAAPDMNSAHLRMNAEDFPTLR